MYYIEDKDQLVIEDFTMPFGGELDPENRWVRLAGIMPWIILKRSTCKP